LSRDLGFSAGDRHENIRRIAEVSRLLNRAGLIVIAALISPYREDRALAKDVIGATKFIEVYLSTPLAVCERRDPKGHYARARRGEIPQFTGVSAAYEAPENPEIVVDSSKDSVEQGVAKIMRTLELMGFVPPDPDAARIPEKEEERIKAKLRELGYLS